MSRDSARTSPEQALLAQIEHQPERTAPRCRHFGTCGGCQLQHVPYPAQLTAKRAMLLQVLEGSGVSSATGVEVVSAEPYGYRNRARFRVEGEDIGYSRRASNSFLSIEECPIAMPALMHVAFALRDAVRRGDAAWPAGISEFELFANADGTAFQLSVQLAADATTVSRDAPVQLRTLCDTVQQQVPALLGAGLFIAGTRDKALSRRVQESVRVEIARWGQPALNYRVAQRTYRVTRGAFFQVNRFLTDTMVERVTCTRSGGMAAWDLYAGAGLFSVPLAERFQRLIAVEIGEPAATDLAAHLQGSGPQHRVVRSTTLSFLQQQSGGSAPDLIVMDPPRAGLGRPVVEALQRVNAQTLVYVSCDAGTFAYDAAALLKSGYTLASLHLLDLFPQTFHTETVAVFRR